MDCLCTTGTVSQRMAEGAMIVDGWYHNIIIISYHSVFWFCAHCDCVSRTLCDVICDDVVEDMTFLGKKRDLNVCLLLPLFSTHSFLFLSMKYFRGSSNRI
jgi:hypothetical protein